MSYQDQFAFKLGAQANRLGKDKADNPYRKGTYSRALWQRGFDSESQKEQAQ